jgi:hypothetical protein
MGGFVNTMTRLMEFNIRDRTSRTVNRLAVHSHDEADQRLRVGKEAHNIFSIFRKLGAVYIDKPNVIGARSKTEVAKLLRVECCHWLRRGVCGLGSKPLNARMFRKLCHCP